MHVQRYRAFLKSRYFLKKAVTKSLSFMHLQLVMSFMSWPFLLAVGLPLSKAALIGNALFAPFLTLFLTLSSCIFICELIAFPSTLFTIPLEYLTSAWISLLMMGNRSWLVALPQPPLWAYGLFPLSLGLILHYRPFSSSFISSVCLVGLMGGTALLLRSTRPAQELVETIPCFEKELTLMYSSQGAVLINPGCLGRRLSAPTFVMHTLIPTLRKRGITKLDMVVCAQPSALNFLASSTLVEAFPVKSLFIPQWTGTLSNSGWSAWEKLIRTAHHYNTALITVHPEQIIPLGTGECFLEATRKLIRKNKCIFPHMTVSQHPAIKQGSTKTD